jgi:hypothetical protein
MEQSLDKFGRIIIENLRDKQIDYSNRLLEGKWKADELKELQEKLSKFNKEEKNIIKELIEDILTHSMHDLLSAFQESNDYENEMEIIIDNQNVADISDGLHGEIFGEEGWIQKYSKYKSNKENDRSNWAKDMIDKIFGKE